MSDERWMDEALVAARSALGRTSPNPAVGAVLVRDGELLAIGATHPVGGPHAERDCLQNAVARGHDTRGATLYVTLEPCCHHGRTPPCTDAILEAGVKRVVVGVVDPFPPMQGKSLEILRDGGVEVTLGVREQACATQVQGFVRAVTRGYPEVTAKAAISLDGHISTASGESQWITGPAARAHAHMLRGTHDAILVGSATLVADDPRLTCRDAQGTDPVPVVLDTELRIADDARLFGGSRRPVLVCAEDAPERDLPADILRVPRTPRGVDIHAALRALGTHGLHRVLVEGGGRVHRSLLDAGLVDHLLLYVGGVLIPGGRSWVAGAPLDHLEDALRLTGPKVLQLGEDVLLQYELTWSGDDTANR